MRIIKFVFLWTVLAVVMLVSWPLGITLGDKITQSSPPQLEDPSSGAAAFLAVCIVNSLLLAIMIWQTRKYTGAVRWMCLVLYVWVVQFVLTQMETWFFVRGLVMSTAQIASIVIAGGIMALVTITAGVGVTAKLSKADPKQPFRIAIPSLGKGWLPLLGLIVLGYPLIYFTFGYFVAWQNEAVRMYYTQSTAMDSFFAGLAKAVADGVYFFQIVRGVIWILVSLPLIMMLQREGLSRYVLLGMLSALPTVQLFIPNPYMPSEVAMTHFIETSTSDFLWGLCMVFGVNWAIDNSK